MFEPEPFGRYELLERIAVGGMAEIFRAKSRSLAGFEKVLSIKRLHPRYGEDVDFIKMLIEEARISVQLNHVNIVQIFDLDKIEDHYFIAMEFVDGRDLYRVLKRANERGVVMPVEGAAWIASEIANGLDYAHRKTAEDGTSLGIVHRDVSPQNVLLSWEGEVKIVDFGIAKAAQRSFETESGVVKGKFYYMSPEQARGERVDHRSDLFSAGIVIYEMLTGSLMYREDDEATLLSRVRKADIEPPSSLRPDVPRELEDIVMRALQREPRRRYQSGRELGDALRKFLYTSGLRWARADLSRLLAELYDQPLAGGAKARDEPTVEDVAVERPLGTMQREEYAVEQSSVLYRLSDADLEEAEEEALADSETEGQPTLARERGADAGQRPASGDPPGGPPPSGHTEEISLHDALEVGDPFGEAPTGASPSAAAAGVSVGQDLPDEAAGGDGGAIEEEPTGIFEGRRSHPDFRELEPAMAPPASPILDPTLGSPVARPPAVQAPVAPSPPLRPAPESPRPALFAPAGDVEDSLDIPLSEEQTSISRVDLPLAASARPSRLQGPHRLAFLAFLLPVVVTGWGISWCNRVVARRTVATVTLTAAPPPGVGAPGRLTDHAAAPVPVAPAPAPPALVAPAAPPAAVDAESPAAGDPTGGASIVEVRSHPDRAVIEVDGLALAERTPTELRGLSLGTEHRVAVTLKDHEPWERRLALVAGERRTLEAQLVPILGVLEVTSEPAGALVEIDAAPRGRTPLEVPGLFIGEEQEVIIRKAGYSPVTQRAEWNGRRFLTIDVELKRDPLAGRSASARPVRRDDDDGRSERPRRPRADEGGGHGYLSVSAIPWAKVYVDRRIYSAETPVMRGRLPAGRHSVKVYYPTLKRFSEAQTVTIRGGQEQKLFFRD